MIRSFKVATCAVLYIFFFINSNGTSAFSGNNSPNVRYLAVKKTALNPNFPKVPPPTRLSSVVMRESPRSGDGGFLSTIGADDEMFDIRTTFGLVGGQALLIAIAVAIAALVKTPNFGFGYGALLGWKSAGYGVLMTLPLGALAWALDQIEESVPALKDVTTATQRSVLALMGATFKPKLGLVVAIALGMAAGLGEELLFRGVLQYELLERIGSIGAVGISSIIFGLLHAVTPVYAFLATLASFYFGYLYLDTGNLVIPIITHAVYDIGALMYAHWCVANLSPDEQTALAEWEGPGSGR